MRKNQVQLGRTLTLSPVLAGGVLSSGPILIGSAFGMAQYDAPPGGEVEADVEGVFSLPKVAGVALTMGTCVYITPGGAVTGTASGNTAIGFAARGALAGDARVDVRLVSLA